MERPWLSITTKAAKSFPPVNVQFILTAAEDTWVFSNDRISGDPNANKVSDSHHLKKSMRSTLFSRHSSVLFPVACLCVRDGNTVGYQAERLLSVVEAG